MFIKAVYDLWYFDVEKRRHYQLRVVLIAFLYGVLNSLALGRPEGTVTWETLALVAILTVGFTVLYCLRAVTAGYKAKFAEFCAFCRNRGLAELGAVSVILLMCFSLIRNLPNGKVEAFSLNSQLRAASIPGPLEPSTVAKMSGLFQKARAHNVALKPQLVAAASERLLDDARLNPDAWPAVLGALSYSSGLDIEAAATYPQKEGCLVTTGPSRTPGLSGISIEELTVVGCDGQKLDGFHFKNLAFVDSTIIYHGGPTVLENVQFKNCKFVLDYSPAAYELAKALAASKSVTVSLPAK